MNPDCGVLVVPNPRREPMLPISIEVDEEAYKSISKVVPKRTFPIFVGGEGWRTQIESTLKILF